jgi:TolA-binding protein
MKKIAFLLFFPSLLFLRIASCASADIAVTYFSGECTVDLHGNGVFETAGVDMALYDASVVRTGRDGTMELRIDDAVICVGHGRELRVSELTGRMKQKRGQRWLKGFSKYTRNIGRGGDASGKTELAGIRGEKKDASSVEWFEEGGDTDAAVSALRQAKLLLSEGDHREAISMLEELAASEKSGPLRSEAAYYLGITLYQNLQYTEALRYLAEAVRRRDSYYYRPALMHYAVLTYLLNRFDESIAAFETYTAEFAQEELAAFALFMLGSSYRETGDATRARSCFERVVDSYKDSDVYEEAKEALSAL